MKSCSKCGVEKDLNEFYRNASKPSGRQAYCKVCEKERNPAYYTKNKKALQSQMASYRDEMKRTEPNLYRARTLHQNNRRRAKEAGAILGSHTAEDIATLIGGWSDCIACGEPWTECDHIVPLSRGGTDSLENLQPLCQSCNRAKHNKEARWLTPTHH